MKIAAVILTVTLGTALPAVAHAQTPAPAPSKGAEAMAMARAGFEGDYKQLVAANMNLTPDEATKFWPVFDQYRQAMAKVGDRSAKALVEFAKNYETLTDAQATALVDEVLSVEREKAQLRTDWAPKFRAVIPAKKAARFFQVENKIDALVKIELAENVPLVK